MVSQLAKKLNKPRLAALSMSMRLDAFTKVKEEIATAQTEMKRASEIRLAENKEFQMTIMDQKATQEILAKALDRLKAFYAKKSLLQLNSVRQPGYKKNAGAGGVMAMIGHI